MRLLLQNHQSPGDVLVLTAAVRDLHAAHPGRFVTAVDTSCPQLWENNPHVVGAAGLGEPDRTVRCQYPLVHESDRRPGHFLNGFVHDLERQLGVDIPLTRFAADVHLSEREKALASPAGLGRYWVVVAGGKFDFTTKWWDPAGYQAVVDHFRGRLRFVQCGQNGHFHPRLRGVVDLVGKTDLREFVRVLYHADGLVCPVTFAMHLAAALPPRPGGRGPRPCVVIAGGREPPHWEMYPGHQFLHTIGALDCCSDGGCWMSRCQPAGDGSPHDLRLCRHPVRVRDDLQIAKCMTLLTPAKVVDAVEMYLPPAAARPAPDPVPEVRGRRGAVAVTIGVGPYAELAELAAREVSARTGLETLVLGRKHLDASGLEHPTYLKFRLADLVEAENVLYFDADMVCLERWDPGRFFRRDGVVAVRDRTVASVLAECRAWGVPPEEYFNSGFMVLCPRRDRRWLRRAEELRFARPTVAWEQSPLNAARRELGVPLELVDRRFNWLGFGGSSLSCRTGVFMAHKLVPDRPELNAAYLRGQYDLPAATIRYDENECARLCGRDFVWGQEGRGPRTLRLHGDGTILPPQPPEAPGYWFVSLADHRPVLSLASEARVLHELVETVGGDWVETANTDRRAATADDPPLRLVDARALAEPLTEDNARLRADGFLADLAPCPPGRFAGDGIVVCGGGEKYLPCAWVCLHMLRRLGCTLPVELWHLRDSEMPGAVRRALERLDVACVNAADVRRGHPVRYLGGYELKPYALLHSRFARVLLLDADNVPVSDPSFLFGEEHFLERGAVFWPDYKRLAPDRSIWRICRVPYRDEAEFESGQLLVDKVRCWRAVNLTMHLNESSGFYYRHVHGDKETFHMAWRMLEQPYAMVPHPIHTLTATMCQHDFRGRRLFQHRAHDKWTLRGGNRRVEGFRWERRCLAYLRMLAEVWDPAR